MSWPGTLVENVVEVPETFTQAWTTRFKDVKHAVVNRTDDKMYLCNPSDKHILQERKSLTFRDYIDEEVDGFTISSSSGTSVVLNTVVDLDVGYLLYQTSSIYALVTAIDPQSNTVTVNATKSWSAGAVSVYKVIECEVEYAVQHGDNPTLMKHFQEADLLMRDSSFVTGTMSFYTDLSGGYSNTEIEGNFGSELWGLSGWGLGPWGGVIRPKPIRVFIPREKSRGSLISVKFTIANAYAKWSLNGINIHFEWVSERTNR